MQRIRPKAFEQFDPRIWTLIPLYRYDAVSEKHGRKRKDGKRPADNNWTIKEYKTAHTVKRCIEENRNVGVRLEAGQLVIDVDPRNGGDEGFTNLCLDLGMDENAFPKCVTGSGGGHYYMTKPEDVLIVDTLEGYPGVEFKSKGRQVVAPGSIHPETLKYYEWAEDFPPLSKIPEIPRALLNVIKRPQRSSVFTGGGQYTQEKIATALDSLDVTDFREHDKWLKIMMACHHASNGDARSEFVEWSTTDPKYSHDAELIGRRWDSLHADKPQGVTYRTLEKFLQDADKPNAQAPGDAKGDFDSVADDGDDDSWLEGNESEDEESELNDAEELSALEKLNAKYIMVVDGGKVRITYKQTDQILKRDRWERMTPQDFTILHSNHKVESGDTGKGKPSTIRLGTAWIQWPKRNIVESVLFDPSGKPYPGHLNTWTGFAMEPSPLGEWTILRDMIFEVLADGDQEIFDYVMKWLAFLIQHPEKRAEVALVFRGGMGVGKGTLGNALARIIGRHAIALSSPDLIVGRFNAHLQDVIFLFADEAIKPYDKQAESRLKAFITEPMIAFEGKGREVIHAPNYLHMVMASNENWVIPAGIDERRFLISDANKKWQGQRDKWNALHAQLEKNGDSGYRRLLFDLQIYPLPENWSPRLVPSTKALVDQKIRSMSPLRQFFFNAIYEGHLPFAYKRGPWEAQPIRFFAQSFRSEFHAWCNHNRINPGGMGRANSHFLIQELKQIFPRARTELRDPVDFDDRDEVKPSPSDGRAQAIELPSLADCRKDFEQQLKGSVEWSGGEDFG